MTALPSSVGNASIKAELQAKLRASGHTYLKHVRTHNTEWEGETSSFTNEAEMLAIADEIVDAYPDRIPLFLSNGIEGAQTFLISAHTCFYREDSPAREVQFAATDFVLAKTAGNEIATFFPDSTNVRGTKRPISVERRQSPPLVIVLKPKES